MMTPDTLPDVPRCLNLDACYVGAPRDEARRGQGWMQAVEPDVPSRGTAAFRHRAVQQCLDTVAVLRAYREPLEGETWVTPAGSEERLLAQIDAIAALGREALAQVASLAIDADLPDPGRVFAALFVLGCVEGRAWLKPIRDIFIDAVARHPGEAAAAVEALSLSANPEVATGIEPLLDDPLAALRAAAVRVLAHRTALSESAWQRAMRDDDASVLAAATCASLRAHDRDACERALQPLLAHHSESLVRLALRAGIGLRLATAHSQAAAISRSRPGWADAPRCLAMFGFIGDASLIRGLLDSPRWPLGIQAAGTLGSIELVPDLLALLARSDLTPEQKHGIEAALF